MKECDCGEETLNLEKYAEFATREDPETPMIIEHPIRMRSISKAWRMCGGGWRSTSLCETWP